MTATRPTELELKYRVTEPAVVDRLLVEERLGPFAATGPARATQHEDHYVDTADGALAKAGFAARLRTSAGSTIISVKSLARSGAGAMHRRDELEGPAHRGSSPHDWPGSAARSLILELAGDVPLVDLVALRQLRTKRRFASESTEVELSVDEVDVVDRGRIVDHFTELEIELIDGDDTELAGLEAALTAADGLRPVEGSKYEFALAAAGVAISRSSKSAATRTGRRTSRAARPSASDAPVAVVTTTDLAVEPKAGPTPATDRSPRTERRDRSPEGAVAVTPSADGSPDAEAAEPAPTDQPVESPKLAVGKTPGVQADDTLAEAGRKVLRFHFARMLAREAGTRAGQDPEELHSMRVATRRMRAAWRVFGDAYRPGRTRRYRRDLRAVAARLGAVRDLDVLIEGLDAYTARQTAAEAAALAPLRAAWLDQREDARELLMSTLDSPSYGRFTEEYREFVRTDGLAVLPVGPTSPHRVRDRMPSRIVAAYEQVRAYEPVLRWADVETLHDLRIAAKWLRYTIEFVREPLGASADPLIERVVALQDHLGALHDADVAAGLARTFLVQHGGDLSDEETAAIGRFLVDRERELARLRRTVGPTWRRVSGVGYRRLLARAVAGL
jgi:CHAD domain-containing protein